MPREPGDPLSVLAVLSAVFMWGASFPMITIGLEYLPAVGFAALRFVVAGSVMIVVMAWRWRSLGKMWASFRSGWRIFLLAGLVGVALPNGALSVGLQYTTPSVSSIIQAAGPVYTMLLAVVFLREHLGPDKVVGTVVAIAGTMLLVTYQGVNLSDATFVGNAIVLVAALGYAMSGLINKVAMKEHHPLDVTAWGLVVGCFGLLALAPVETAAYEFTPMALLMIVLLGLFPGAMAFILYNIVLQRNELSTQVFFIYLIPVFANILSFLVLDDLIDVEGAVYGMIIILGVAIAQYRLISRWGCKDG
ncbi:MAG: DMT family transporter [Methanomassiliicoccales archaeon]